MNRLSFFVSFVSSVSLGVLLGFGAIGCAAQSTPAPATAKAPAAELKSVEFITAGGKPGRPFSPAVRAGKTLYLSGQIGTPPGSDQVVAGGIEAETRQVLENIKDVLSKSGSSMDQIVKCTVMLADIAEWARMNSVYVTYFPNQKPARSALGVSGLALGARVEIECIAAVD